MIRKILKIIIIFWKIKIKNLIFLSVIENDKININWMENKNLILGSKNTDYITIQFLMDQKLLLNRNKIRTEI